MIRRLAVVLSLPTFVGIVPLSFWGDQIRESHPMLYWVTLAIVCVGFVSMQIVVYREKEPA